MNKYNAEMVIKATVLAEQEQDVWNRNFKIFNMSDIQVLDVESVELGDPGCDYCGACDIDDCLCYDRPTMCVDCTSCDSENCPCHKPNEHEKIRVWKLGSSSQNEIPSIESITQLVNILRDNPGGLRVEITTDHTEADNREEEMFDDYDEDGYCNNCGEICTDCECLSGPVVDILPKTNAFSRAKWLKAYQTLTAKRFNT